MQPECLSSETDVVTQFDPTPCGMQQIVGPACGKHNIKYLPGNWLHMSATGNPPPRDGYARTMQIMGDDRQVLCRDCSSLASATGVAAATDQMPNTSSRSPSNLSASRPKINVPKSVFASDGGQIIALSATK